MTSEDICLFARKPYSFEDLKEQIDREISPEEVYEMVRTQRALSDTFECWNDFYKANLSGSRWWIIVLEQERVELLIDTQGYNYPRYAGILDKAATKFMNFKYEKAIKSEKNDSGRNYITAEKQCKISISNGTKKELDELLKSAQKTGIANDLDGVISFMISQGGGEAVYEVETEINITRYMPLEK